MTAPKLSAEEVSVAIYDIARSADQFPGMRNAIEKLRSHIAALEVELAACKKLANLAKALRDDAAEEARAEEREACAKVAEIEPEVPGPMPEELRAYDAEHIARTCVRLAKRNIAAAIRARKEG